MEGLLCNHCVMSVCLSACLHVYFEPSLPLCRRCSVSYGSCCSACSVCSASVCHWLSSVLCFLPVPLGLPFCLVCSSLFLICASLCLSSLPVCLPVWVEFSSCFSLVCTRATLPLCLYDWRDHALKVGSFTWYLWCSVKTLGPQKTTCCSHCRAWPRFTCKFHVIPSYLNTLWHVRSCWRLYINMVTTDNSSTLTMTTADVFVCLYAGPWNPSHGPWTHLLSTLCFDTLSFNHEYAATPCCLCF